MNIRTGRQTVEARDWDEGNRLGVEADLLDKVGGFLNNFLKAILGPLGGVHLVDSNDKLLDTKGVCKKSVFTGLAILGNTSFELTSTGGDDKDSTISLGGTSDHVLDKVTMSGGIYLERKKISLSSEENFNLNQQK